MIKATKDLTLPTTITGSLPRPGWYTENLGARPFRDAFADARFREQYTDAIKNGQASTSSPTATPVSIPTSAA
jgi:hypothetical protein